MDKNNANYRKRERKRRLSKFQENNMLTIGWVVSLVIFALVVSTVCDFSGGFQITSAGGFLFGLTYLAAAAIGFLLSRKMRADITRDNAVSPFVRRAGYALLPFVFTGNFFIAIAGFAMVKKEKNVEYTLAYFAFITTVIVGIVSALNLFKPATAGTFTLGMVLLSVLALFYIACILLVGRAVGDEARYKRLMIPAVLLILSGVSGNLFAVALGMVIISKIRSMRKERSVEWIDILRRVFRNYMSIIGLFIVIFLLMLSLCSYFTFDYAIATENNYSAIKLEPSMEYPFGTDDYGRCVFTRIVFGARISLVIGFLTTILPFIIGGLLGAVAGHYGSVPDNIIMRALDILYAVPSILLAIAIVAAFGASTVNLIIALSIGMIPIYARTMRAQVMVVTSNEFVEAARACGQKEYKILLKHIVPNALAPMIVRATLSIGAAVLSTSSLSFLGLGVEPHVPEWGNILKTGSKFLETQPYLAIFPGLAIIMIVLAFNFFGDGLRDALDPKLK